MKKPSWAMGHWRKEYHRAVRGWAVAKNDLEGERLLNIALKDLRDSQAEYIEALETERTVSAQRVAAERAEIRVALGRVSVYQDLVDSNPLALMVDGLARDHEELEARIEAILDLILIRRADGLDQDSDEYATLNRIAGLAQGQIPRVPDTIPDDLENP